MKMHRKPLFFAFILTSLLLALHLYALSASFYWYHRWADIPMHILGGAALGAFLLAFFSARRAFLYFSCILGLVLAWEVFEYQAHISTGQPDYWIDTIKDVIDGIVGSIITLYFGNNGSWR